MLSQASHKSKLVITGNSKQNSLKYCCVFNLAFDMHKMLCVFDMHTLLQVPVSVLEVVSKREVSGHYPLYVASKIIVVMLWGLGLFVQGKALLIYHLSGTGLQHDEHRPHILLMAGMNGDDPVGTEMLVRLARHLTTGQELSFF